VSALRLLREQLKEQDQFEWIERMGNIQQRASEIVWADIVNRDLEEKNIEPIDHRSYRARGILLQPTIHEGVSSKKMKKKGKITERMRINILIRKDNSLIISLRKTVEALTELVITAAKLLIPALADALEGIRVGMIILECERKSINKMKHQAMKFKLI